MQLGKLLSETYPQTLQEELTGAAFHPLDDNLLITHGKGHLTFWNRRKDGFFERTDIIKPVDNCLKLLNWNIESPNFSAVKNACHKLTVWARWRCNYWRQWWFYYHLQCRQRWGVFCSHGIRGELTMGARTTIFKGRQKNETTKIVKNQ